MNNKKNIFKYKRYLFIYVIVILLSSCSVKSKYFCDIPINKFNSYSENYQLAKDIASYDYQSILLKSESGLNKADFSSIKISLFRKKDKEVFIRIILSMNNQNILSKKDLIIKIYKIKIEKQIRIHYNYRNEFKNAYLESNKWIKLLNSNKYYRSWQIADEFLKKKISKNRFKTIISRKNRKCGTLLSRNLSVKQFYSSLQGLKGEFILFQYLSSHTLVATVYESVTLKKYGKRWRVIGFNFRY